MADILEIDVLNETPIARELAEELEGTFSVIAFTTHKKSRKGIVKLIQDRQGYFKKKYGKVMDEMESDVAVFHLQPAYDTLQELLEDNPSPERIRQTCEECLYQHINPIPSGEILNLTPSFEEFYNKYLE